MSVHVSARSEPIAPYHLGSEGLGSLCILYLSSQFQVRGLNFSGVRPYHSTHLTSTVHNYTQIRALPLLLSLIFRAEGSNQLRGGL